MPGSGGFSHRVAEILRDADRHIRGLPSGDHHRRYDYLRATMAKLVPVDAFFVGFYRADATIAYPYTYDLGEYESPGVLTFGPRSLGAWLLQHKKTYTYAMDQGRLLGACHRFGDTTRASRDVVTVPLRDHENVLGMASMQSYTPHAFDDEAVRAFEWLCRTVVAVLRREHEDAENLRELDTPDDAEQGVGPTFADVVVGFSDRIEAIRDALEAVRVAVATGDGVLDQVAAVERLCTLVQQEMFAVLTRPSVSALEPLSLLTSRERQVADLVGQRLSNQEIAEALTISVPTVKTHVHNIMKKFRARQRAEVIALLHPFG
jgi:DNA-binding CsgD family transcriptional regulator